MLIEIGADGRVMRVTVLSSTPSGVFEQAVQKGLLQARFTPAITNGRQIASRKTLTLAWTLKRRR